MPHALLLSGAEGAGKRHVADQICRALYGDNDQALRLYAAGNHPDFFQVVRQEKKKEISVDQIRDLSKRVTLTSQMNSWRIVWIDPTDKLSRGAANALLKILEEPPKQVLFILVTDELPRVLPTILSRCQHLKLGLPSQQEAITWLSQQPQVAALSPPLLQDWLALCHGSPLSVLAELEAGQTNTEVPDALAMADQRKSLLERLIDDQVDLVSTADALLALDGDVSAHLQWLQCFALDLLKCTQSLKLDFYQNRRAVELLSRLAPFVDANDVLNYLVKVGQIKRAHRGNVNAELSLQTALLPWTNRLNLDCLYGDGLGLGYGTLSLAV